MSRLARVPIALPTGVEFQEPRPRVVQLRGKLGTLSLHLPELVRVRREDGALRVEAVREHRRTSAMLGTAWALLRNMVHGVSTGFVKKLCIYGVGYRARLEGAKLTLNLGYSHPMELPVPEGLRLELPSNTEINVYGADKQQVGQFAARLRALRPPSPFMYASRPADPTKSKGVNYVDEIVLTKKSKKKQKD